MPKAAKSIRPGKVIHPNSRVAAQLARKAHHDQRVQKHHKTKCSKYDILGDKLMWFQENLDMDKATYTKADACKLVEQYLDRFHDELEQIELKNSMKGRDGKQHASRLQAIKMTQEMEAKQYNQTGFEMPDLVNAKNLKYFREWSGELRYLQNIKMRTVTVADAKTSQSDSMDTDAPVADDTATSSNHNTENITREHSDEATSIQTSLMGAPETEDAVTVENNTENTSARDSSEDDPSLHC